MVVVKIVSYWSYLRGYNSFRRFMCIDASCFGRFTLYSTGRSCHHYSLPHLDVHQSSLVYNSITDFRTTGLVLLKRCQDVFSKLRQSSWGLWWLRSVVSLPRLSAWKMGQKVHAARSTSTTALGISSAHDGLPRSISHDSNSARPIRGNRVICHCDMRTSMART